MIQEIIKLIRNSLDFCEKINRRINQYKTITKEPALPSYAYINWGLHLLQNGNKSEGMEKLNQSILMNKSNPEVYISFGIACVQDENFQEAMQNFKKAVRLDDTNAKAWGLLAGAYSELNENQNAKHAFETALKLDRCNPITHLNYGIFLIKTNQKNEAKVSLKKAYLLDSTNMHPIFLLGMIALEEKKYIAAFSIFSRILSQEPFNPQALHYCGHCSYKLGKYKEAIEFCTKSSNFLKDKLENYYLICESYLNLKDKEKCFESYEKFEQFAKNDWKFYHSWANSCVMFEQYELAVEKANISVNLNDKEFETYNILFYANSQLNNNSLAKNYLLKALELKPQNATLHCNLAQIYQKENDLQNALSCYKKALSLDISLKHIYFNIAGVYYQMKDYKNAIKYWEKSIEYDKTNSFAYLNLAMIHIDVYNNPTKGIRYIRSAYELDKKNPDLVFKYGAILLKSGEIYRAKEKFEEAYNLDNNFIDADIAIAECLVKLNTPQEALERIKKYENTKVSNEQDFLTLKLIVLNEIFKKDDSKVEIKEQILKICDKIIAEYGEDTIASQFKQIYQN